MHMACSNKSICQCVLCTACHLLHLHHFVQLSLALQFSNTTKTVLSLSPFTGAGDHELRSVSFSMQTDQTVNDSIILQLVESKPNKVHNITLEVGVIDRRLTASLISNHFVLGIENATLTVSRRLMPEGQYRVEVTR